MSLKLRNVPQFYIPLEHQRKAVEDLGRELIQRGFHSVTTPASWLNFTPDHLDRVQEAVGKESMDRFTKLWRNEVIKPRRVVDWNDMSSKVSEYFTVGENLRYDARRIPTSTHIKNNIIEMCNELDIVREAWGSPILITSGYRDPVTNKRIGGAKYSQHLTGRAVDVKPVNGRGLEFEQWLDEGLWKNRALGYGMKSGRGFSHLDLRPGRIRWDY